MQTLVNNRKIVVDIILQQLKSEKPKGDWTIAILNRKIQEWSNKQKDDKYKPYCQIAIYYLKKKLSKLE
jgi:subtilisin-like proprotein convertase family protein